MTFGWVLCFGLFFKQFNSQLMAALCSTWDHHAMQKKQQFYFFVSADLACFCSCWLDVTAAAEHTQNCDIVCHWSTALNIRMNMTSWMWLCMQSKMTLHVIENDLMCDRKTSHVIENDFACDNVFHFWFAFINIIDCVIGECFCVGWRSDIVWCMKSSSRRSAAQTSFHVSDSVWSLHSMHFDG